MVPQRDVHAAESCVYENFKITSHSLYNISYLVGCHGRQHISWRCDLDTTARSFAVSQCGI